MGFLRKVMLSGHGCQPGRDRKRKGLNCFCSDKRSSFFSLEKIELLHVILALFKFSGLIKMFREIWYLFKTLVTEALALTNYG